MINIEDFLLIIVLPMTVIAMILALPIIIIKIISQKFDHE